MDMHLRATNWTMCTCHKSLTVSQEANPQQAIFEYPTNY